MRPRSRRSELAALALSALAHALLLAPFAPALWRARASAPSAPDRWAGGGAGDEVSVELGTDGPAVPAAVAAPAAAAAAPAATAAAPAATAAATAAAAAAAARAHLVISTPTPDGGERDASGALAARAEGAPRARVARPAPPSRAASRARPGAEARAGAGPGAGEEGPARGFGSEATANPRDLGRAFTRAIGLGSQADAAWGRVPAGWKGTIDVVLEVDEAGALAGFQVLAERPAGPLRELVRRTVDRLRGGLFAPRGGAPGAGKVRLALRADASDVDPGTVAGGRIEVDALFENGQGRASFTQPGGRRVEVEVDARRPAR
ncbi:MAG TPA: hypothetical protein VFS00_04410 [Polyangiaceae bacterium]|nr:hypothetical protein [Polyangiaceae bacterium]